ncbi:hypothetical protein HYALB_00004128 [Hymenoscyphus albidus]|uniref:Uncharacterized protein n=1 Tax=Hymenoscyphus albidus TaxID=595503 RepID=A0A9N9Q4G7_9HELO|nr:hypothetical protein HYALB_00004128 [Hymenoscyphus albidus]
MVTLFSLGTIGAKEFGLLCLWAVSPLAGQASLRIINLINITETTILAPWITFNFTSNFQTIEEDFELAINYTYALYNARAGSSGLKHPCADENAQLLLPSLPSNGSLELPECNSIRPYSNNLTSLVGQRIVGLLVNLSSTPGVVSQETPLSPLMWEDELLTSVEFEVGQYI